MKRLKNNKQAKVNNWLTHKETRDEIWDLMTSKWAIRAEGIAEYGREHLPAPVKNVLRTTIKTPLQTANQYRLNRKEPKEVSVKPLRFSSASK